MKLFSKIRNRSRRIAIFGYTLVELMMAAAVMTTITLAMVSVQLYGLRVYTLAATKLSATAGGLKALNVLREQIRSAKLADVGNYTFSSGNLTNFNAITTNGALQAGNAVRIFPTTNFTYATAPFTLIFLQPVGVNYQQGSNYSLVMLSCSNNAILKSNTLANYITNQIAFYAEDFQRNVLTTNYNNRVIEVVLQFSQWEYPIAVIGTNNYNAYDFYQLRTRVSHRAID